jgi:RNA polymerase sigma-70 factor (ECF subfamily)
VTREVDLDGWIARLSRGDRSAFEPLYEALHPRATRLARMKLHADFADDIAQSALLKVFSRASEFEPGRPCLPWFYAIVANEIRGARRKDARIDLQDEIEITAESDPEAELVTRELSRSLDLAIASLDQPSAEAIHAMLERGPMPNIPAATFRKRVSRAYAKLRWILGGQDAF